MRYECRMRWFGFPWYISLYLSYIGQSDIFILLHILRLSTTFFNNLFCGWLISALTMKTIIDILTNIVNNFYKKLSISFCWRSSIIVLDNKDRQQIKNDDCTKIDTIVTIWISYWDSLTMLSCYCPLTIVCHSPRAWTQIIDHRHKKTMTMIQSYKNIQTHLVWIIQTPQELGLNQYHYYP